MHYSTRTDSTGHFRFENVTQGTYAVRAYESWATDCVQDGIEFKGSGGWMEVHLVMPAGHWLVGKLHLPDGTTGEHLVASATMPDHGWPDWIALRSKLSEDGRFKLGPFHPGIAAGDANAVFDLGDAFPGRLQVRVTINGRAPGHVFVRLYESLDLGGRFLSEAMTDPDGAVTVGPVFGGLVDVVVTRDDPWAAWFHVERGVLVPAGRVGDLSVHVELVETSVRCLDGNGEPVCGAELVVYRPSPVGWNPKIMRTDSEGGLSLLQPPGRIALSYLAPWRTYSTYENRVFLKPTEDKRFPLIPSDSTPTVLLTSLGADPDTIVITP